VKHDSGCTYESSECTESRVKDLLKTVLNMRREVQFLRVTRLYNGPEVRSGSRPIVACFSKWSDKEEVLRKRQLLKMKGIQLEEDLSRAGRARRRELEKLMRSIKGRDPDRRCFLTYDRLVVDDNVYIFNELDGRVERLPNKLALSSSSLDISSMTDTYNDTGHNFRQANTSGQSASIRRGLSVDCLLERY